MPFPFGPAPTLGELVEKAVAFGAQVRHSPTVMTGPNGPVRFSYLWIDPQRFAPLPDMGYGDALAPDMVDYLARRLNIPTEEFWPGFSGFGSEEDG